MLGLNRLLSESCWNLSNGHLVLVCTERTERKRIIQGSIHISVWYVNDMFQEDAAGE